ncbi:MAG TPA: hypothetical protein VGG97_23860 [Bryobacteraceae bacterium]|jgi:hypothetical protein
MKNGRRVLGIALIVASANLLPALHLAAAEPPEGFLRKIAARESETASAREEYTYRQSLTVQEFNVQGGITGEYRDVRDITFTPSQGSGNPVRYEQVIVPAHSTLSHVRLTPEDFADIRNIEPFLLTADKTSLYEGRYRGEETIDGILCFVEFVRPRQILSGQRFFEGTLWVRETDFSVIRSEGQAVPQIDTLKEQNLTPHFTTIRREVDGKWFFPVETYSDDTLFFRDWPQRLKTVIRYMNYKKFGAESTIIFGDAPLPATPAIPVPPASSTPAVPPVKPPQAKPQAQIDPRPPDLRGAEPDRVH